MFPVIADDLCYCCFKIFKRGFLAVDFNFGFISIKDMEDVIVKSCKKSGGIFKDPYVKKSLLIVSAGIALVVAVSSVLLICASNVAAEITYPIAIIMNFLAGFNLWHKIAVYEGWIE